MAQVSWSAPALSDLEEIIRHIARDSMAYAERFANRIGQAPRRLTQFPASGRIVPEFNDPNIRELIFGSYRIIYWIRRNNCHIVAIIHGSRDVLRHITRGPWDVI